MILREVAIDPEIMSDVEAVRQLCPEICYEQGRLLARAPDSWVTMARNAIKGGGHQPMMRKTLNSKLLKLQKQLVANPMRAFAWDLDAASWLENALAAHDLLPFDAIVAEVDGEHESPCYSPFELFVKTPAEWSTELGENVERSKEEISRSMMPLACLSRKFLIIDEYFKFCDPNYRDTLTEILRQVSGRTKIKTIEIHIASTLTKPRLEKEIKANTSPAMLAGIAIEVNVWPPKHFHDRFVLTELGAFSYGHGFAVRGHHGNTHVHVQRVGVNVHSMLWNKINDLTNRRLVLSID